MVVSTKKEVPCTLSLLRAQNTRTFGCHEHFHLHKFVHSFKIVKLFFKHPYYSPIYTWTCQAVRLAQATDYSFLSTLHALSIQPLFGLNALVTSAE
jgi:hypothetical protein